MYISSSLPSHSQRTRPQLIWILNWAESCPRSKVRSQVSSEEDLLDKSYWYWEGHVTTVTPQSANLVIKTNDRSLNHITLSQQHSQVSWEWRRRGYLQHPSKPPKCSSCVTCLGFCCSHSERAPIAGVPISGVGGQLSSPLEESCSCN